MQVNRLVCILSLEHQARPRARNYIGYRAAERNVRYVVPVLNFYSRNIFGFKFVLVTIYQSYVNPVERDQFFNFFDETFIDLVYIQGRADDASDFGYDRVFLASRRCSSWLCSSSEVRRLFPKAFKPGAICPIISSPPEALLARPKEARPTTVSTNSVSL